MQHYPRGGKALRGAFSRFQSQNTVEWFQQRGVRLKTEADGRMFPTTDNSGTIVHCLIQAAQQSGVKLWTGATVQSVIRAADRFQIELRSGQTLTTDRVLLATGSNPLGYAIAKSLGHTIVPPCRRCLPSMSSILGCGNWLEFPLARLKCACKWKAKPWSKSARC